MRGQNKILVGNDYAELIIDSPKYGSKVVLIDKEDVEIVEKHKWKVKYVKSNGNFYATSAKAIKPNIILHRLIMNYPKDKVIDHINGNPLDNRKCNLRICSQGQNCQNKRRTNNKTFGIKNVSWYKPTNKWTVSVTFNKKRYFGGYFENLEEAKNKAIQMRKELHSHNVERWEK